MPAQNGATKREFDFDHSTQKKRTAIIIDVLVGTDATK